MIKADVVKALCEKGYYKNQAEAVVDEVFDIIRLALARGEQVQLRGFGTFEVKVRKGRYSRDISAGEMRVSQDREVPVFRASKSLKEAVHSQKEKIESD